jgi:hypothetical protein
VRFKFCLLRVGSTSSAAQGNDEKMKENGEESHIIVYISLFLLFLLFSCSLFFCSMSSLLDGFITGSSSGNGSGVRGRTGEEEETHPRPPLPPSIPPAESSHDLQPSQSSSLDHVEPTHAAEDSLISHQPTPQTAETGKLPMKGPNAVPSKGLFADASKKGVKGTTMMSVESTSSLHRPDNEEDEETSIPIGIVEYRIRVEEARRVEKLTEKDRRRVRLYLETTLNIDHILSSEFLGESIRGKIQSKKDKIQAILKSILKTFAGEIVELGREMAFDEGIPMERPIPRRLIFQAYMRLNARDVGIVQKDVISMFHK